MDKPEINEELVIKRYQQLAGLLKDGQMVNKDKENRAREHIKEREKFVQRIFLENQIRDNSKYGEFILQTNEVQFFLVKLIFLRSFNPSNSFERDLERLQLGPLISYLNVCAQTELDLNLLAQLKDYKDKRDALAHKMFTAQKLTVSECENAIKLGGKIIEYLVESLKSKQSNMIKASDKISDFPSQFNKLVELVKLLEKRVMKLELTKKKPQ